MFGFNRSVATPEEIAAEAARRAALTPEEREAEDAAAAQTEAGAGSDAPAATTAPASGRREVNSAPATQGTFRVFNARMDLVAQVGDEAEAQALALEHKGSYKSI